MSAAVEWASLTPGQHRLKCPACGRDRRSDKTLGVTVDHTGKGVAHCFRCEYVETHTPNLPHSVKPPLHIRKATPSAFGKPLPRVAVQVPAQHESLSPAGRALWRAAHPLLPCTPASHYLNMRRCVLPPVDGHLRWLPAHRHPTGHTGPALVALLTDAITREPRSLHFTWIAGGRKADVQPPRLLLAGHRKAGAVCRLWPDDAVTYGLGVAEGIETALSLAHGFNPVWACVDAGNLAAFPALPGIDTLLIARDRDPAGEKAAAECAARWVAAGKAVLVTQQGSNDLNDTLAEVAA